MESVVWKALGDKTRRAILDLLREGPKTTGELSAAFSQSRFGVMKHIGVLKEAKLVTVKAEGRKRWHHLNALPLREIYVRWLGPYQEFWSTALLALRDHVETEAEAANIKTQQQKGIPMSDFNSFEIVQTVELKASTERVWRALTTELASWWAFHVIDPKSTLSLDARLGGRFEERLGDSHGTFWGEVVDIRQGERLRLNGPLGMTGAAASDYVYELKESEGVTTLTLTHHAFGYLDEETEKNFRHGWEKLLTTYLAAWVHDKKTYQELES